MTFVLNIAVGLGLIAVAAGSWLGWQLLSQNGRMLLRLEELEKRLNELGFGGADEPAGLPLDSLAPDFDLPDLVGERKTLAQCRGQTVLLIFFNPACGFCRELLPKLVAMNSEQTEAGRNAKDPASNGEPHSEQPGVPHLLIISTGDVETNRQFFNEHKVTCPVLLQKEMEVGTAYKANGTPTGYLINSEGRIASDLAVGAEALLALLADQSKIVQRSPAGNGEERATRFGNRSLAHSKIKRDGLKAGTPAPDFRLPRLDGGELSLGDMRGRRVLLVFSSPHCGPCNTVAPELQRFHRHHPEVSVVMVSRGEPDENRAKVKEHRLTFPVVLQQQWEISRLYTMFATPVAYLINESGVIVQDVAVGVEPILALIEKAKELVERNRPMTKVAEGSVLATLGRGAGGK
jgi:peroxiredoxin